MDALDEYLLGKVWDKTKSLGWRFGRRKLNESITRDPSALDPVSNEVVELSNLIYEYQAQFETLIAAVKQSRMEDDSIDYACTAITAIKLSLPMRLPPSSVSDYPELDEIYITGYLPAQHLARFDAIIQRLRDTSDYTRDMEGRVIHAINEDIRELENAVKKLVENITTEKSRTNAKGEQYFQAQKTTQIARVHNKRALAVRTDLYEDQIQAQIASLITIVKDIREKYRANMQQLGKFSELCLQRKRDLARRAAQG